MDQVKPVPWQHRLDTYLADQRVHISVIGSLLLVAGYVVAGHKPLDVALLHDAWTAGGLALLAAGLAIRTWAAGVIRKGKALATGGPYSLCRHPLYLGSFLMMFGFCILLDHPLSYFILLGPVLLLYLFTIRREERKLGLKHSSEWVAYSQRTPAFFPWRWPASFRIEWSFSQWLVNREYNALLASVLAVALMKLWFMF